MDEYYLVLSPQIGMSPNEFVTVWNEEEKCRAVAIAREVPSANRQYDLNLFAEILLAVTTNIASSTLYDLIKQSLARRGMSRKHINIEALQKPDGTRFLVVDIDIE
jgi:hypothetical protein